jgi:hypothetical protein
MISFLCYLCHVIGNEDLGVGKVQHDVVADGVHVSCDTVAYVMSIESFPPVGLVLVIFIARV